MDKEFLKFKISIETLGNITVCNTLETDLDKCLGKKQKSSIGKFYHDALMEFKMLIIDPQIAYKSKRKFEYLDNTMILGIQVDIFRYEFRRYNNMRCMFSIIKKENNIIILGAFIENGNKSKR